MTDSYRDLFWRYSEEMNNKIDTFFAWIFTNIILKWKMILGAWVFGGFLLLIAIYLDKSLLWRVIAAAWIGYFAFTTPGKIKELAR